MLPPLLVRASAGTGKTYQLTGRLIRLLIGGAPPSSILATTFTRKAAGEILKRVLTSLARAASDPEALAALQHQVDEPSLTAGHCRLILQQLMREIHRFRVCTLDSFFSQLARCFPIELGLPSGWRLTDEIEEKWLQQRTIESMLAEIEPNELQSFISMLSKGRAIRAVAREIDTIVNDGYSFARWCQIEAWQTLQVPTMPEPKVLSEAANVLRHADLKHKTVNQYLAALAEEIESGQWEELATKTLVLAATPSRPTSPPLTYRNREIHSPVLEALQLAHDAARTFAIGLLDLQSSATGQLLERYSKHLSSLRQLTHAFSFDDLAFGLAKIMGGIAFEELEFRLDSDFGHLLLDEFQDTSPVQWQVLKPLAIRSGESQPGRSFFCVGDTKQAIYGWRGGCAEVFDTVAAEIPESKQMPLDVSHRSSPVITHFVTQVFQNLARHPKYLAAEAGDDLKAEAESRAVERFVELFPPHTSAQPNLPGHVRIRTMLPKPDYYQAVAEEIRSLAEKYSQHSIGVLTRTNDTVALLIGQLKRLQVDVSQEGGNPLTDSALVELILSALMLSEHPADLRWAYHVSHSPLGPLLTIPPLAAHRGQLWDQQLQQISSASDRIREKLEISGLARTLHWLADAVISVASEGDVLRLRQLLALAHSYQRNPQPRISRFVDLVRSKRVQRARPAQTRVMTIHQAKGLEFDLVVLPELDGPLVQQNRQVIPRMERLTEPPVAMLRYLESSQWNFLPKSWQKAFQQSAASAITEALCLLYVAVTRPRQMLEIFFPPGSSPQYSYKTAASLIYHALECTGDATLALSDLYYFDEKGGLDETGGLDWSSAKNSQPSSGGAS